MDAGRGATAEIEITLRCGGERALFIVETGSRARAQELMAYFAEASCEIRPITVGPVVACAAWVRAGGENPLAVMAEHLRSRYALSICEPGFTASMHRVATQLARAAEGDLHPLETCTLCDCPEPFPTVLRLQAGERNWIARFCESCLPESAPAEPISLCRHLLRQAGGAFAVWDDVPLKLLRREDDVLSYQADEEPAQVSRANR